MEKKPFVTKEQVEEIVKKYPTPFHLYDEAGIRANAEKVRKAFAWNPGFQEYFAVKATPNPFLMEILREYGCGCDCSSATELMLCDALGIRGHEIMFSSNDTPAEDYALAGKLGAIINLDDITHIGFVEKILGKLPETMSCRYNPGGVFTLSNGIMDNPGDSKYGMTGEQMEEAFRMMKEMEKIYLDKGYAPPATEDVLAQMGKDQKKAQQVHNALIGAGTLVRMDAQICFARQHYDEAVERIKEQIRAQGQITLGEVRDLLGTSRKYAMVILETLDREKVTKKVGDARVLL